MAHDDPPRVEDLCTLLADDTAWEGWVESGLPADLEVHSNSCAQCRVLAADLNRLRDGLEALAHRDTGAVLGIDLTAEVMAALAEDTEYALAGKPPRSSQVADVVTAPAEDADPAADLEAPRSSKAVDVVTPLAEGSNLPAHGELARWKEAAPGPESVIRTGSDSVRRRTRQILPWAIAALAASVIGAFVATRRGGELQISAPRGATLLASSGPTHFDLEARATAPFSLVTGRGQTARVSAPHFVADLLEDSELTVAPRGAFALARGAVELRGADAPFSLLAGAARVEGLGHVYIERNPQETNMQISKKKAGVVGGAVLVALVYGGWATLTTSSAELRGDAPVGLAVDDAGNVSSFPLSGGGEAARGTGRAAMALAAAAAPGATEPEDATTGARWSESEQAVVFVLAGEVFDELTGKPIESFVIEARATELTGYGPRERTARFEDQKDGKLRIEGLGRGKWRVTARAKGYAPLTQSVSLENLSDDPYLVVPLSTGARLSGQVVDWRGRPVEGATVGLLDCFATKKKDAACATTQSASDGRFTLNGVPADETFSVHAEHPRYGYAERRDLRRSEGESEHVVLELSGIVRVFGEVTKGKDQTPVAGAIVVAGEDARRVTTGPDGRYEVRMPLEARPPVFVESLNREGRAVRFAAYPEKRSAEALVWVEADTHVAQIEKNFRLSMETTRLYGQIKDDKGAPVANAKLKLHNSTGWYKGERGHETFPVETVTGEDGRYSIDGIPSQAGYDVRFIHGDDSSSLGYVNIADQTEIEANFTLGSARIRGRFVDAKSGETLPISERSCHRMGAEKLGAGGGYFVNPSCLENGRFELSSLSPGEYRLQNRVEWMSSAVKLIPRTVTVGPNEVVEDFTLEVEGEPSDNWKFRVTSTDGRFLAGVHLRYQQDKTVFTSNLDPGADGVAPVSLDRIYKEVFFDAPGHSSERIELGGRDAAEVIEVRLKRSEKAQ